MMIPRSRQSRSMWLADDFYFIAFDLQASRFRVSDRVACLGLAAALIAELVLWDVASIRGGRLRARPGRVPPDALAHVVQDRILKDPATTALRDWLLVLSEQSYRDVVERLLRAGHVQPREVRRRLRTTLMYEPADSKAAGWPEARITGAVAQRRQMSPADWVLSGLVVATGLDSAVFYEVDDTEFVREAVESLPEPLQELLAETEAAVGAAVLNPRS